ncbi:MAG: PilZ domain-containing protein, partial [Proteobacteria bacterium]|nr:PilZ domain-containing protein [Pseudomonadota bacterium]
SATLIDIGAGGIGVISEKAITPGAEVSIFLKLEGNYAVKGNVVWASYIYKGGKNYYQMGIEADSIILTDIKAIGFSKRSELVAKILKEIKEQGLKVVEKL